MSNKRWCERTFCVALCGNPNVGKSTVFNALTGLRQHTGNWAGKTVETARGEVRAQGVSWALTDLPGTYSLLTGSPEEEVACDFLCLARCDATIVVCDGTCLERSLNLALQVIEASGNAVVCVNLMDEAARRGIDIDLVALEKCLGVPVVGCAAKRGKGLKELKDRVTRVLLEKPEPRERETIPMKYPSVIEECLEILVPRVSRVLPEGISARFAALRILAGQDDFLQAAAQDASPLDWQALCLAREAATQRLARAGLKPQGVMYAMVTAGYGAAKAICAQAVKTQEASKAEQRQLMLDRRLCSKRLGMPIMLLLLGIVFYITLAGANAPSAWLSETLLSLEPGFAQVLAWLGAPLWLQDVLAHGMFRVAAWVVAVMLPPMAIFFPLFTLLEDLGFLPRVAFNLDKCFHRCHACGKQALCMCMGLGCNAVGVTGCRIIQSPRERLIAILTNALMPCNGRFPTLIALIGMFFVTSEGLGGSLLSAAFLVGLIVLCVLMTFLCSRILSRTVLKGLPSAFTLELPPFRRPKLGEVLVRSALDRTLFVLGRAVMVAAPAGIVLWILANVTVGEMSLLAHMAAFLDPLGRLMGMDGVILIGFILGFPANEIVLPIIFMTYLSQGILTEPQSLWTLKELLLSHGWTVWTALSMAVFTLFHWPCSTTLMTVYKETRSPQWTIVAAMLPTAVGAGLCMLITGLGRIVEILF